MPDASSPKAFAERKVHLPLTPETPAEQRARFYNSADAFNLVLKPVPDKVFEKEANHAMSPNVATGYTACDSFLDSDEIGPSTSPFILARYARINDGESLESSFNTIGSIWYVIKGCGVATIANEEIAWSMGDVFVLPGGKKAILEASGDDAILWVVTNEPQMAFENTRPIDFSASNIDIVHYPSVEIDRQVDRVSRVENTPETAGIAVIFSSEKQTSSRNITPTLTLAMNTLPPGEFQRPHRHNSVAVSLIVQGEGCYSMIDGARKEWAPWATTLTPPEVLHSHHNEGDKQARFLIVQDGGLYYHARTMGFSFG